MTPRERVIEWAINCATDPRTVVLDTETLGIRPDAGLCDLAIVAIDGTVLFDSLLNPGRSIPAEATAVHRIADADVASAPTFADVYPDVAAVLGGRRVLVYNVGFDAAVLDCCCDEADLPALGGANWQCAMKAYSDFRGERSTNWRRPGLKWHKLGEACAAMGVVLDGAHRARADAEATRRLVIAMAGVCPLDSEDAFRPDGTCAGCGGEWLMGKHFHPNEIADAMTAIDASNGRATGAGGAPDEVLTEMQPAPSDDQMGYVRDLAKRLRIPGGILDRICADRFGQPFAGIDKRQCSRLISEMVKWRDAPANYRRAMGQRDLF